MGAHPDPAALKALTAGRLPPGSPLAGLPRLRFDRVAQRLVRNVQAALCERLGDADTLVVTVTAPIRQPARTVDTLASKLKAPLSRAFEGIVCGNRVRARLLRRTGKAAPRVIVFVHNPRPAVDGLIEWAQSLLLRRD
ncbi:MAG: hypothetical protein JSS29_04890 [Proteobacteria bacterium]|nr:hypothetical protein [Pseudomonadota bacterium]